MSGLPFTPGITTTKSATFDNTGTVTAACTGSGNVLRMLNAGTVTAFVAVSTASTITASGTTSMPLLPSTSEVVTIPDTGTVYVAGITSSSTAQVYFTRGQKLS